MGERKISWLELFYDLVYVIAISKITHLLAQHPNFNGLFEYVYFFGIIFWGWLNGSLHHDLHGNIGLRTRFMTLWQMMVVAALIVTLSSPSGKFHFNTSISLLIIQAYITYLWWSVGIYDKNHRILNRPYTICYLLSMFFLFLTLFLQQPYIHLLKYISLAINFLPPFIIKNRAKKTEVQLSLTTSMLERLGLFSIIIFGEVVLGVINGIISLEKLNLKVWVLFSIGIIIVFALWWIFFILIADRESRKGFLNGYYIALSFIPTLMALGTIGATFNRLFLIFEKPEELHSAWIKNMFGISFCLFMFGITLISNFLVYTDAYEAKKRNMQFILACVGVTILLFTLFFTRIGLLLYLILIATLLIILIVIITRIWLSIELNKDKLKL